jgi:hypothetical protein
MVGSDVMSCLQQNVSELIMDFGNAGRLTCFAPGAAGPDLTGRHRPVTVPLGS